MADVGDDLSQCTVCFESYGENGDHIPRLLPCSHTLCSSCIRSMIRKEILECPECRVKHEARNRHKSFPQNKYIVTNIKNMRKQVAAVIAAPPKPEPKQDLFPKCKEHGKEESFYCATKGCQKAVCSLCMLKYHKYDDVVDIEEDHKNKTGKLIENVPCMIESLQAKKAQILSVNEDLENTMKECVAKIKSRKDYLNEQFDDMLKEVNDLFKDVKAYMNDDVADIEDLIAPLNNMKGKLKKMSYEKILTQMKIYRDIEKKIDTTLSYDRIYPGLKYNDENVTKGEIDKVCGKLTTVEMRSEFAEKMRKKRSDQPIIIDPREKTPDGTVYRGE